MASTVASGRTGSGRPIDAERAPSVAAIPIASTRLVEQPGERARRPLRAAGGARRVGQVDAHGAGRRAGRGTRSIPAMTSRARSARVYAGTPMVRCTDVPPSAVAEWIQPRGRYSASPGRSTVSIAGSSRAALGDRGAVVASTAGPRAESSARVRGCASASRPRSAARTRRACRSADRTPATTAA